MLLALGMRCRPTAPAAARTVRFPAEQLARSIAKTAVTRAWDVFALVRTAAVPFAPIVVDDHHAARIVLRDLGHEIHQLGEADRHALTPLKLKAGPRRGVGDTGGPAKPRRCEGHSTPARQESAYPLKRRLFVHCRVRRFDDRRNELLHGTLALVGAHRPARTVAREALGDEPNLVTADTHVNIDDVSCRRVRDQAGARRCRCLRRCRRASCPAPTPTACR